MADEAPTDNLAYRFPVSVKGVLLLDGGVVLLKNGRGEWELPGGKLEPGEAPAECVAREVHEELGVAVRAGPLVDAWVYRIAPGVDVLILTYGCFAAEGAVVRHSDEHGAVGRFRPAELGGLPLPGGYRASIEAWAAILAQGSPR